jgi:Ala-tRNA(Pro) deacylase
MSIPRQISDFLDTQRIPYQYCRHSLAYTAQGIAHAQHVSGKEVAKVVMVLADGRILMAVLPASHRVNFDLLKAAIGAHEVRLASEEEFKDIFPGCELGAMPPLGNLYNLDVYADETLQARPSIVFNAGTHIETIQMSYSDFTRVVKPKTGKFAELHH